MDEYLHDSNAVNNIFGEDKEIPQDIPFFLRLTTVRHLTTKAMAISIYMGKEHYTFVETLLSKIPFPDVQLVLTAQK